MEEDIVYPQCTRKQEQINIGTALTMTTVVGPLAAGTRNEGAELQRKDPCVPK